MAKVAADAINLNMIAAGYDNYAGLTNIELIRVDRDYFLAVRDYPNWRDGQEFVTGDGIQHDTGFASTAWNTTGITYPQWWYLYTTILGGNRSGKVTIKTRRWAYPVNTTMADRYVIANAILTLPPPPDMDNVILGYPQLPLTFTRLDILHEDTMHGELTVTGASTAQTGVIATPEKLTAFTTAGISSGVTVSASGDSHTAIVAGGYVLKTIISFTATASTIWTFQFYVNAAAVGTKSIVEVNATPDAVQATLFDHATLAVGDVATIYVNSATGGGADITVTDAQFSIVSI